MKKEIDAIRAKDIPQGGLTQGQQTQIARNEQRMEQVKFFTNRLTLVHFFFKLVVDKLKAQMLLRPSIPKGKETGAFLVNMLSV